MNHKLSIAAAAASLLLAGTVHAQQEPASNLPLWEIGVGAAGISTPAYPGSEDRNARALVLPYILYRGEVLRADQSGIGARLLNTDRAEFDIGLAGALPSESDDVSAREGMPDLGTLLEFGPRLKLKLADVSPSSRVRLELPLRAVIEARGGLHHQGWTFEPRLVYETRGPRGLWSVEGQLAAVYGDRGINRYFYEVQPQYATAWRPAYQADSGLILTRVGLFASRRVGSDLRFFGFLRYESYANAANRDSPLMRRDNGVSAGFGLAWTLKRSTQPARGPEPVDRIVP